MTKAIETLAGDDANRFREAIRPHVLSILGEAGHRVFIGPTAPEYDGPYLWIDTSAGITIWLEDGL